MPTKWRQKYHINSGGSDRLTVNRKIELMCPAGSFETLQSAIKAGADSVYFGVGNLNMRARSAKFSSDDLEEIARICDKAGVKSYLALNTVMYDTDILLVHEICDRALAAGISAVIACDMAAITYARSIGLEVHMSTQANISNIESVKFYSQFADVVVLARELSLEQIKYICSAIEEQDIRGPSGKLVRVELFIHGALCVSISGKCYMSLAQYNHSANRGDCLQTCRREYLVKDAETGDELVIGNGYVMSPKDLCTIGMIDKLVDSGVSVFKIEGRARGPEYVHTVTSVYAEAIHAVSTRNYTAEKIGEWKDRLSEVFNRGFWENGYYLGNKTGEWCEAYGSKATNEKVQLGRITHYFAKNKIAEIYLDSKNVSTGDKIMITGPTTGTVFTFVESIYNNDDKSVESAAKGDKITVPMPETVRINDKVFIIRVRNR